MKNINLDIINTLFYSTDILFLIQFSFSLYKYIYLFIFKICFCATFSRCRPIGEEPWKIYCERTSPLTLYSILLYPPVSSYYKKEKKFSSIKVEYHIDFDNLLRVWLGLVGRVIGHIFLSLSLPSYIFDIKLMIKSLGEILDRGERVLKRRGQGGGGT